MPEFKTAISTEKNTCTLAYNDKNHTKPERQKDAIVLVETNA